MSSRQSNGTGVSDGSLRNSEAEDSSSSKGSQSADGEKELFDRERFPDRFYPGVIVLLDRVRGRGLIRAYSGREIRYALMRVHYRAPLNFTWEGMEEARQALMMGPTARLIEEKKPSEATRQTIAREIEAAFVAEASSGSIRLPGTIFLVAARLG